MINNKQLESLNTCLISTNDDVKEYIQKYCKKNGYTIFESKKYIFGYCEKSTVNVMLTAHYDVVHEKKADSEVFYDSKNQVFWSPNGLGADDRAGIFIILNQIETIKPKFLLFTDEEEKGGLGGDEFCKDFSKKIDTNLFIALDRKGNNNFVTYDDDNKDVEKFIVSNGFVKEFGSFTDICNLMEEFNVSGVNLSVGYENNHTFTEILRIKNMINTIEALNNILIDKFLKTKHVFVKKEYERYNYHDQTCGFWQGGTYKVWNNTTRKFEEPKKESSVTEKETPKDTEKPKEVTNEDIDNAKKSAIIEFNSPNNCAKFDIPKFKAKELGSCGDCIFAIECENNFESLKDFCPESGLAKEEAYGNGNCKCCSSVHDCYPDETCIMHDMFIFEAKELKNCDICTINCKGKEEVDGNSNTAELMH